MDKYLVFCPSTPNSDPLSQGGRAKSFEDEEMANGYAGEQARGAGVSVGVYKLVSTFAVKVEMNIEMKEDDNG